MEIVHLPPTLVPFLDALAHTGTDHGEELEGFEAGLADLERWLAHHGGFNLHAEEALELENLAVLHEQVRAALANEGKQSILDALVPPLYQAIQLMDRINKRREQPHFSPLPAINEAIMAGAAFLQKRAQPEAVAARLAILGEFYRQTRQRYRSVKARLRAEVVAELDFAFAHLKAAWEAASAALEAGDRNSLHDALAQLKEAGDLVNFLVEWDRQDRERLNERHRRFNIPNGAGQVLELGLESARTFERTQWERGTRNLTEVTLPDLRAFFAASQARLVLPVESRLYLIEGVEQALDGVESALQAMNDHSLPAEVALDGLEAALEELSAAFTELEAHVPRAGHLQGTLAGAYWEAMVGALGGTVPVVALLDLLQSNNPPPEWEPVVRHLRDYVAGGDVADLQLAALSLAELHPPPSAEEDGTTSWSCAYCGQVNPAGVAPCQACSAKQAEGALDPGWEA